MSAQQLNSFMERLVAETALQKKVGGAVNADKASWINVVPIAKEEGFTITIEDLNLTTSRQITTTSKKQLTKNSASMSCKQLLADGTHGAPGVVEAPKHQPDKAPNNKIQITTTQ